jgi:hypothetical protein
MNLNQSNVYKSIKPIDMESAALRKLDIFPKNQMLLPNSFSPLPYTVIIGKGKLPKQATGNRRLQALVENQLENYSKAKFRRDKTFIVSNIIHSIQQICPEGGAFVKFDGQRWWEMSDDTAREKITATFRDCLHNQYKSSTKNKVEKRRARRAREQALKPDFKTSAALNAETTQQAENLQIEKC